MSPGRRRGIDLATDLVLANVVEIQSYQQDDGQDIADNEGDQSRRIAWGVLVSECLRTHEVANTI